MRIAVFFPNTSVVGWSAARGIGQTLRRMGHDITDVAMPTAAEANAMQVEYVKSQLPPYEVLQKQDVLLVSGPEHIAPWIEHVWGMYEWKQLTGARVCWLQESCRRDDYNIDFDAIRWCGDEWFFPAIQDAEFHDQEMFAKGRSHWLAFGVDTRIFRACVECESVKPHGHFFESSKVLDVGFMGLLYKKRQVFVQALRRHNIPPIHCGRVEVQDIFGYQFEECARRYAENIRQIKVFINMPALSRLMVAKVYEVLACGTFLLTPQLPEEQGTHKNMQHFESHKHLMYYSPSNLPYLAQLLREYSSPEMDEIRERIAAAGCAEVHKNHSLELRLTELLAKVGVKSEAAKV
jgi:Glycosyl transferases group 1